MCKGLFGSAMLLAVTLIGGISGCSQGESQDEKLSRANTLSEVVEVVANEAPSKAYTVDSTKYLAVIFDSTNVTRDYPLMTSKYLMPVLLDRYPDMDRFFFAWSKDGVQFLKIQFDRTQVEGVRWDALKVKDGDLQKISSMYWAIPALR